ncbi:hypothetical protein [Candidatus Protochlamydia phocaeensis]|uniref:hypothetical protein n=1 Tax=Candidatus Protochlamydia phocaeensis TaxID=1414722 RepID=UPI0008390F83|nr:hypothetical protein [Candidatus Protochlamydia phocaeensis]
MSAVPQKKLCWNCDGNVSKEIDNCPYCGVYLHAGQEEEDASSWGFSSSSKKEEIPAPLYQVNGDIANSTLSSKSEEEDEEASVSPASLTLAQLKQDVFPLLLLMFGSVFFLFGIILLLFSQNGTLTLQWDSHYWPFFLLLSFPAIYLGWRFLHQMESEED